MAETKTNPAAPDDEANQPPESAPRDLRKEIDAWFFNHFNQQAVLNYPDVYALATTAKADLLKLLGLAE